MACDSLCNPLIHRESVTMRALSLISGRMGAVPLNGTTSNARRESRCQFQHRLPPLPPGGPKFIWRLLNGETTRLNPSRFASVQTGRLVHYQQVAGADPVAPFTPKLFSVRVVQRASCV